MITHEILPLKKGVHTIRQKRRHRLTMAFGRRFYIYENRFIDVANDWVKTGDWSEYGRSEIFTK